jgi:PAS domain S-box-containing protein
MLCAIFCIMGFFTVLSHRLHLKRYSEQVRLATTLALVTEHSPIMLAAVDAEGRYRYVNNNYAHFHGKSTDELIGNPVVDTVGADTLRQIRQTLLKNDDGRGAYRSRHQDPVSGIERWLETSVQQARTNDGAEDGFYAILRDITDEVRTAEQVNFLAYHDSLTGLPNRALMLDRLRQAILRGERKIVWSWCVTWIWMVSNASMTPGDIPPVTACSSSSPTAFRTVCAAPTRSPAWVGTSSSCCWAASRIARRYPPRLRACSRPWSVRSPSPRAGASPYLPASAYPCAH